jgi:hypothetical protein
VTPETHLVALVVNLGGWFSGEEHDGEGGDASDLTT